MRRPARSFASPLAADIERFLAFKRARGCAYERPEFTLLDFDQFVAGRAVTRSEVDLQGLMLAWLGAKEGRKPNTVAFEVAVIRQLCLFLRRSDPDGFVPARTLASRIDGPEFLPHIFSENEIRTLLAATSSMRVSLLQRASVRTLILLLYCTGLRPGEAARLRLRDVDLDEAVLFVEFSKGRSRYVPFGQDLADELKRYLQLRSQHAADEPDASVFLRRKGDPMTIRAASDSICRLLRRLGLKPPKGRVGPRPYDLRHTFAVHRLTRWYREGADIAARLPWLSAYMGHCDLTGTERYLRATPELLEIAGDRFAARLAAAEAP
jgi:integrase/recombinase XerD